MTAREELLYKCLGYTICLCVVDLGCFIMYRTVSCTLQCNVHLHRRGASVPLVIAAAKIRCSR